MRASPGEYDRHTVARPTLAIMVRRSIAARYVALVAGVLVLLGQAGCVQPAAPAPAEIRATRPPWSAPRDAVSYMDAAGLNQLPLSDTSNPHTFTLSLTIDGSDIAIPANIGLDRVRALQAPVHTHGDDHVVWLEGRSDREVTLSDFFLLWGVRFDGNCIGAACGIVRITKDGADATKTAGALVLRDVRNELTVELVSD